MCWPEGIFYSLRQAGDPGILGTHLFSAFHLALSRLAGVPYHAWLYNDVRLEEWNLGSYICNLSILETVLSPLVQSIKAEI